LNRVALVLLVGVLGSGCARPPDVVVLFVDTLRADRLGCAEPVGRLPSLERYTVEGSCFERVASTSGWTLPTETSMLVSAYPEEHGVTLRNVPVDPRMVPVTAPLADDGYLSALFSGNVLTAQPQFQPYFDELWVIDRSLEFTDDVDDRVVDRALEWLEEEAGREPLFVVLQLYGPHYPYCPPGTDSAWLDVPELHDGGLDLCDPDHADLLRAAENLAPIPAPLLDHAEALYDLEVAHTDAQVERFEEGWDALGRTRKRLTVVVTDHGEAFGEHGRMLHGRSLHRETSDSHMAFFGEGIPRAVVDRPVEFLDLAPTLAALLDLEPAAGWRGLDLTPLLDDPHANFEARAYQVSNLLEDTQRAVTREGDDGHRFRLLDWEDEGIRELYDATADPHELLDLYGDPAYASEQAALEELLAEMADGAATGGPVRGW